MESTDKNNQQLDNNSSQVQAIKTSEFMKETIKQRPLNKRKLARKLIVTVSLAVLFGFIACFTFLFLEPIIDKRLNPPEETEIQNITFVEESIEEEVRPEDMIAEEAELQGVTIEQIPLADEQIEQVLNEFQLGVDDYISLSEVVTNMAKDVSYSLVSVVGISQDKDWFDNEYNNEDVVSGVIVADNGRDLLILTNLSRFKDVDSLEVSFFDGSSYKAEQMTSDSVSGLGIVAVNKATLKRYTVENASIIQMGATLNGNLNGTPIVALGRPFDIENSIGIGYVTSCTSTVNLPDADYKLLTTDIGGSKDGSGILVNIKGQLLGIIDMTKAPSGVDNFVCGIAISELKRMIEKMSNGITIPYLGIYGMDVTQDISENIGVPIGVYIKKLNMDSPLLDAGIQSGDIITEISGVSVTNFQDISNVRLTLAVDEDVKITVMRQGPDGYTPMEYKVHIFDQN